MDSTYPKKAFWTKIIVIMGLVILCILLYYLVIPDGLNSFRGIRWGTDISNLSKMSLVAEEGELKFYSRQDDVMKIEDIDIDDIVYGFYNDKFYTVILYYNSVPNFRKIKELLYSKYGRPYRPDDPGNKYFWDTDPVNLLLVYDDTTNKGRISYYYHPTKEEAGKK